VPFRTLDLAMEYKSSGLYKGNLRILEEVMDAPEDPVTQNVSFREETVTPFWWGLFVLMKYRTTKDYRSLQVSAVPRTLPYVKMPMRQNVSKTL
jgi:hypothetical protein